jgi:hypothetical protein
MRALLLAVIFIGLAACSRSEWQELALSDAGFTVLMRGQPNYARQPVATPAGKMEAHLYSSDRPDSYFAVGYSDYPLKLIVGVPPQQVLSGVRDTWVRRIDGKLIMQDSGVKLAGKHSGLEFIARGTVNGADTFLQARLYLVDQRLYQLIALGRTSELPQGVVNRFLNSFRLIDEGPVSSVRIESAPK